MLSGFLCHVSTEAFIMDQGVQMEESCINNSCAWKDQIDISLRLLFDVQWLECLAMPCLFESGIRLELLYRMLMPIVYQYVNPSYCVADVMHCSFFFFLVGESLGKSRSIHSKGQGKPQWNCSFFLVN